jgi:isopenicillin N synthase-like dioxygenase
MNDKTVPLINLASFGRNAEDTKRIADGVRTASQNIGFFLVSGHGVSETLVKNVYASAK